MALASLVTAACSALVSAAVTDSWEEVRHKVASWFGRGAADRKALERLDATRAEIAEASPAEREQIQHDLAQQWAGRFKDLIADHPQAAGDLPGLVEQLRGLMVTAGEHSVAAGRDITSWADRGGVAAGVIHGNVSTARPTSPGPGSS